MEKEVLVLLTREVLDKAIEAWEGSYANLRLLGQVENFVYEFDNYHKNFILRITHSSHRSKELVKSELNFLNHLSINNLPVCKPILSKNNSFTEIIKIKNGYFIVCAFEKAKGHVLKEWNDQLIFNLGSLVGKLHSAAKTYSEKGLVKRQQWFEEDHIVSAEKYLPKDQKKVLDEINTLTNFLKTIPQTKDNFGLVHTDIHKNNFFVYDQDITLFDFDDSCYHWFLYDISTVIYSASKAVDDSQEKNITIKNFMKIFFEAYRLENELDEKLLAYFLRLRDLLIYVFLYKKWDINNLSARNQIYFDKVKNRVENFTLVLDLEYKPLEN